MVNNLSFRDKLVSCNIDINKFAGKTFMITGATGLIGKNLAISLLKLSETEHLAIRLILPLRNKKRLSSYLAEQEKAGNVCTVECDITNFNGLCQKSDYIIHCASVTESKKMVARPTEVIKTNIFGTINILEYAKKCGVQSVVYLSSMEAYGFTEEDVVLTEERIQYLNPLEVRSCYPESKRMAENICISYASEFGVSIKIVRLAQTFGKGVKREDKRVFAEFARCACNMEDIVLLTDGKSARMYLDVEDAITGILVVLLNGNTGEAYNIANKDTYCTIEQMALLVTQRIGKGKICVKRDYSNSGINYFSPSHKFNLDTSRIEELGWKPYTNLSEMYENMILGWSDSSINDK